MERNTVTDKSVRKYWICNLGEAVYVIARRKRLRSVLQGSPSWPRRGYCWQACGGRRCSRRCCCCCWQIMVDTAVVDAAAAAVGRSMVDTAAAAVGRRTPLLTLLLLLADGHHCCRRCCHCWSGISYFRLLNRTILFFRELWGILYK